MASLYSKGPAPVPGQRPGMADPRYAAPAPRPAVLGAAPGKVTSVTAMRSPAIPQAGPNPAQMGMIDQNSSIYLQNRGLTAGGANFGQSGVSQRGTGYNASTPGNMPVGIVNGNQTYEYGPQGAYGGHAGTILADPHQNTSFYGTTAPNGFGAFAGGGGISYVGGAAAGANGGLGGVAGNPRFGGTAGGVGGVNGYGAGGNGATSGAIGTQLQRDLDEANRANEQRYQEALGVNASGQQAQQGALDANYNSIYGTLGDVLSQQQGLMSGLGNTAHERENRRATAAAGHTATSLAGRGLYNSTVLDSLQRGNAVDSAFIQNGIDEDTAKLGIGVLGQYGSQMANAQGDYARQETQAQQYGQGQRAGIIESRTDQGPNIGQYLQQLNQPGALTGANNTGYGGQQQQQNNGGLDILQQYLASLGGQGQGQQSQANPYVDPRTIAANNVVRQRQQQQGNRPGGYSSGSAAAGTGGPGGGGFGGGNPGDYGQQAPPPLSSAGYGQQYDPETGQAMYYDEQTGTWEPLSAPY